MGFPELKKTFFTKCMPVCSAREVMLQFIVFSKYNFVSLALLLPEENMCLLNWTTVYLLDGINLLTVFVLWWRDAPTFGLYMLTYQYYLCIYKSNQHGDGFNSDVRKQLIGGALAGKTVVHQFLYNHKMRSWFL